MGILQLTWMGRLSAAEAMALVTAGLSLAVFVMAAFAFMIDPRTLHGASVWAKPMKFGLSFFVHMLTLALFVTLLRDDVRHGWKISSVLTVASACSLIEVIYVTVQALRGRASHFNSETAFEAFMYVQVMGGAALAIVACTFMIGLVLWRDPLPSVGEGLLAGAAWGAMISAVLTLVTAGVMSSGLVAGPGHWVGGLRSDATGLPLLGWSTTGGDLRVPHFFATHILQVLPALGCLIDAAKVPSPRLWIAAGAMTFIVIVLGTFAQALAGKPFLS